MLVKPSRKLTFDVTFYDPIAVNIKHVVYCLCGKSALRVEIKRDVADDAWIIFVLEQLRLGESQ